MDELTHILQQHNVDTASFSPVLETPGFDLRAFAVHGDEAGYLWFKLRDIRQQTGHCPVILGDDNDLQFLRDAAKRHPRNNVPDIIAKGLAMSPRTLFDEEPKAIEDEEYEQWQQITSDGIQTVPGMPDGFDPYFFSIPRDHRTDKGYPRIYVGLVPTLNSWEIPAYLRFGSWNACPPPETHVCTLKYWHDLYGTEVVGISHDVVETLSARLPARREDAEALAFEQYQYCPDIVEQGVGSLAELANNLQKSELWFFWWD